MKKFNYHKLIRLLLIIAWMGFIFALSAQHAEESTKLSNSFMDSIFRVLIPGFSSLSEADQDLKLAMMAGVVRKTAHFMIYAILGFLIRAYFSLTDYKNLAKNLVPVAIAFIYATTDEIHQALVPGRSCEIRDIFIDTIGAALGILIFILMKKIVSKLAQKKGIKEQND
jgi:VanZ family protein